MAHIVATVEVCIPAPDDQLLSRAQLRQHLARVERDLFELQSENEELRAQVASLRDSLGAAPGSPGQGMEIQT